MGTRLPAVVAGCNVRGYATGGKGKKKAPKDAAESKMMAKLKKKLEKKKQDTSASESLISSVLGPQEERVKGVPPMSDFMPSFVDGGPAANNMSLMKWFERRQLVETMKKRNYPHFKAGSIVRVEYKDYVTAPNKNKLTGLVIAFSGDGLGKRFIVRTALDNEAHEVEFPLLDPLITKITTLKYQRATKCKLFYMRTKPLKSITFSPKMEPTPPTNGEIGIFVPPRK